MKPPRITAAEIAKVLRLSVDELHDVIKRHPDFPVADANGFYSRADVFTYLNRVFRERKTGTSARQNGAGSIN